MSILVSKPCPRCRKVAEYEVSEDCYARFRRWKSGEGLIQNMLPELRVDQRERFQTGYCGPCWTAVFDSPEMRLREGRCTSCGTDMIDTADGGEVCPYSDLHDKGIQYPQKGEQNA